MGDQIAPHSGLGLPSRLYQLVLHTEGTAKLFESNGCFNPLPAPHLPPPSTPASRDSQSVILQRLKKPSQKPAALNIWPFNPY